MAYRFDWRLQELTTVVLRYLTAFRYLPQPRPGWALNIFSLLHSSGGYRIRTDDPLLAKQVL